MLPRLNLDGLGNFSFLVFLAFASTSILDHVHFSRSLLSGPVNCRPQSVSNDVSCPVMDGSPPKAPSLSRHALLPPETRLAL